MTEFATYHTEEQIGVVTLSRPDKLNAMNADVKQALIDRLKEADADASVSVVLLEAKGRAFSVGFDIGGAPAEDGSGQDPFRWEGSLRKSLEMCLTIWSMTKPVVASVRGYALGGGCELAMMSDLTIASEDAKFGEPEIRFSHVGPVMMMPWVIGLKRARELILFGDMITAATALEYGLINRVVKSEDLDAQARQYAKRLALVSPEALRWAKRSINRSAEIGGLRTALEAGVDSYISLYAGRTRVNDEFGERVKRDGLKSALSWRENQFRELEL